MHFELTEEQQMIVETTRKFVEQELYPHEAEVERTGIVRPELVKELQAKAIEAGLYAANIPEEFGGAGLDTVTWLLYERELGRANYALHWTCVARPSNILCAGTAAQREKYLARCVRGETWDCLAMTEPGAGSDLRGMTATAKPEGHAGLYRARWLQQCVAPGLYQCHPRIRQLPGSRREHARRTAQGFRRGQ
jgi:alkylation response protein AidB-like acyl-CoA dehydrogenase